MFLNMSVILFTGGSPGPHPGGRLRVWPGGSPGPHPRARLRGLAGGGVSRPTPRGEVEGSGWGGSPGPHLGGSPGPHLGGSSPGLHLGGIPECTEAPSPRRWLLLRAVCILLECILVSLNELIIICENGSNFQLKKTKH